MRRLVCACVVRKPPNTGFLTLRPISCNAIFRSADQQHLYTFYQKMPESLVCSNSTENMWSCRWDRPTNSSEYRGHTCFACITCNIRRVPRKPFEHEAPSIARATPQLLLQNMYDGYSCIFYLIITRGFGGYRFDVVCPSFCLSARPSVHLSIQKIQYKINLYSRRYKQYNISYE